MLKSLEKGWVDFYFFFPKTLGEEALALRAFWFGAPNPTSNSRQLQQISVQSGLAADSGKVHPGRAAVALAWVPCLPTASSGCCPRAPRSKQSSGKKGRRRHSKRLPFFHDASRQTLSQHAKSLPLSWSQARVSTSAVNPPRGMKCPPSTVKMQGVLDQFVRCV